MPGSAAGKPGEPQLATPTTYGSGESGRLRLAQRNDKCKRSAEIHTCGVEVLDAEFQA